MTKSMHIIGSRHSGGAEMFFIRLVTALNEAGHSASFVARTGSMVSRELPGHIEQDLVGMVNVRDPFSRRRISRIVAERDPDIVQTYMGRATRLTRIPGSSRALHVSRLGGFYKLDGYRHADAWVGNTRAICDYLVENGFPVNRVFQIPNFVDDAPPTNKEILQNLRANLGIPAGALVVLGVGRFVDKKGFRFLIEAFSRMPDALKGRPVHLLMVGSGPEERKLVSLAATLKDTDRVHWAGWQTDPAPYYELSDVFVCPSLHEPLGNVILEAWKNGVPVVSTATHGALELIEDGVNGIMVPCQDPEAITGAVVSILGGEDDGARRLADEGRSVLKSRYSREAVVRSYLDLYDQLLAAER